MNVVVGAGFTNRAPVPITVKVYIPGLVPRFPELAEFEFKLLVQLIMPPRTIINGRITAIDFQLRRRDGTTRKAKIARTAPPFAPSHPLLLPNPERIDAAAEDVVFTEIVVDLGGVPGLRTRVRTVGEHVGKAVA